MPAFSVIVATHKRPNLLRRALQSVKAQAPGLAQIVVVSDVPCADSYAVAAGCLTDEDVFVQRAGTSGPAESRNIGIGLALGDYVIFLDDDDALSQDYLANALIHVAGATIVFSDYAAVTERMEGDLSFILSAERRSLALGDVATLDVKNFIPPACVIYPRAVIAHRRFDPEIGYEDWDFLLNASQGYPLIHAPIDGPIVYTRDNPDNRGHANDSKLEAIYRRVYKKWPGATTDRKLARQNFLAAAGLAVELADV
jgi:glycosyltransferase involved in cell wall biosynthesis